MKTDIMIPLEDLKATVLASLDEARQKYKFVGNNKVAQAHMNALIIVYEKLMIFIANSEKEGTVNMEKLKELATGETGAVDELLNMTRGNGGFISQTVLEIAKGLKAGKFERINEAGITWNHFSGTVYNLVNAGKLDESFGPVKRGDKFFLAHFTDEQNKLRMDRSRKRSSK